MPQEMIDLVGEWEFALDGADEGLRDAWWSTALPNRIGLPGSTDAQGFGEPCAAEPDLHRLTRALRHVGPAWYRRTFDVPASWAGLHARLFIERAHWETQAWLDGTTLGMCDSLSTPHVRELGPLAPGRHTLALRIDNRLKVNLCHSLGNMHWAHSVTDETQTNWNGAIGRLAVEAHAPVWIDALQADASGEQVHVRVRLHNASGAVRAAHLDLTTEPAAARLAGYAVRVPEGPSTIELDMQADTLKPWDEFTPRVYHLHAHLHVANSTGAADTTGLSDAGIGWVDHAMVSMGRRALGREGTRLLLNGRPLHLRGTLESCVFPRTGYPPTDVASWARIMSVCREYGLNHLRFHSWCPPRAAFEAADAAGMLLQVELPIWDGYGLLGRDAARAAYALLELERILDTYGNHPSFCFLAMGNEWGDGRDPLLRYLVDYARGHDARHLYSATSHPADTARNDDFFVAADAAHGAVRGLGPFEQGQPATLHDFGAALASNDRPLIAHEVGQPCVYPGFEQLAKYTGHLRPRNLEAFRDALAERGMANLAGAFQMASGGTALRIYKENIEANLRTNGLAGFQLLGLQDYPGQGSALVGVLDAFWDSKGLIDPAAWRMFCAPTVLLARMQGFVWTGDQTLEAELEAAHYGPESIAAARLEWSLTTAGRIVACGEVPPCSIEAGRRTRLGRIRFALGSLPVPVQLELRVCIAGTDITNAWPLWVYPPAKSVRQPEPPGLHVATQWDQVARDELARGGRVVLLAARGRLRGATPGRWEPIFWNSALFPQQKRQLGLLVDPVHPALGGFPTPAFGDWQWHDLMEHGEALNLDAAPAELHPLAQWVPDYHEPHKWGAIWEARAGAGRLLVCTLDLTRDLADSPAARALRASLLAYAASERFAPPAAVALELLDDLLAPATRGDQAAGPPSGAETLLHVRGGLLLEPHVREPWDATADTHDEVLTRRDGFTYTVEGQAFRDHRGHGWCARTLRIALRCPDSFRGELYLLLRDLDVCLREAHLFFAGRDLGPVSHFDGAGKWLRLEVDGRRAVRGELLLEARATRGPDVLLSELVLVAAAERPQA